MIYLLLLTMTSCNFEQHAITANTDVEGWQRAAILKTKNSDTMQLYDMSLFMRYHPLLIESDTLILNIATTTPSEAVVVEQITIHIDRRESNRSVESDRAQLIELPYRRDVRWREVGEYQVAIYPTIKTQGVEAVGLVIDKNREK